MNLFENKILSFLNKFVQMYCVLTLAKRLFNFLRCHLDTIPEFVKYDRFDGTNFVHWKDKMLFLLTNMKISYLLDPDLPAPTSQDIDQVKAKHNKQG
uniref:Uncharacterized protein n=1 Tax=Manihot esculenta TaxID=3983 RepID=A0A2C9U4W9_MANES